MVMMMTSAGHRGDAVRCKELGVAAYLMKPIRQSELREAIARVLGAREQGGAIPLVTRYSLGDARDPDSSLRVLLAEDNAVNQRLATRLLEKRGHRVMVAANGREVLAALDRQSFDAVLMDVQMPEMGGLEATRLIRQRERHLGGHIPIIAMTAHAMKGDRAKCLEAGMDGYVSKPIRPDALFEEIRKHMKTANQSEQSLPPGQAAESQGLVLDTADLLNRVAGDAELLAELVSVFRGDCPQQMQLLRESIGAGDAHPVERTAHALKGALANLGALRARNLAAQLEQMGRGGDLQGAVEVCAALEREIAQLEQALDKLSIEVAR
jgi:CheY-like chemotaxis protein